MKKYQVARISASHETRDAWNQKLHDFRPICMEKDLTVGKGVLLLLEKLDSLEPALKIHDLPITKDNKVSMAIAVPAGLEDQWNKAYKAARIWAVKKDVTTVSIFMSLITYALSHPEILDTPHCP